MARKLFVHVQIPLPVSIYHPNLARIGNARRRFWAFIVDLQVKSMNICLASGNDYDVMFVFPELTSKAVYTSHIPYFFSLSKRAGWVFFDVLFLLERPPRVSLLS